MPLIAYRICIAQRAPAQLPGDHWPGDSSKEFRCCKLALCKLSGCLLFEQQRQHGSYYSGSMHAPGHVIAMPLHKHCRLLPPAVLKKLVDSSTLALRAYVWCNKTPSPAGLYDASIQAAIMHIAAGPQLCQISTSDVLHAGKSNSTRFYTACSRPKQLHASNTCV